MTKCRGYGYSNATRIHGGMYIRCGGVTFGATGVEKVEGGECGRGH